MVGACATEPLEVRIWRNSCDVDLYRSEELVDRMIGELEQVMQPSAQFSLDTDTQDAGTESELVAETVQLEVHHITYLRIDQAFLAVGI